MSILIDQDGLSFLVRHTTTRQVVLFGYRPRAGWGEDPIAELLDAFPERPGEIICAVEAEKSILVPSMMATANPAWAQQLLGQMPNFSAHSAALDIDAMAYLPEGFLPKGCEETLECSHHGLLQMERLGTEEKPVMHVHLFGSRVLIMATSKGTWELVNSFPCATQEELLYHLGNVSEQLDWNRKECQIWLSGYSAREYQKVLEPYFGKVALAKLAPHGQVSSALRDWNPLDHLALIRL